MILNLDNKEDILKFEGYVIKLRQNRCIVELKEKRKTRSSQQNSALHLFFTFISDALNEFGHTFKYFGLSGKELELKYTPNLVKNTLWRPIQIALFGIESTSDIDTKQMNDIIDVIVKFFCDRGYPISFPSIQDLYYKTYGYKLF